MHTGIFQSLTVCIMKWFSIWESSHVCLYGKLSVRITKLCAYWEQHIYIGAFLICIDNKHLTAKVPRGNGTPCQVLGVKLKDDAQSYKCKNYYGKKVWTVNAADVEWVQCEHVNKSSFMTQLESQIKELENELDLPQNNHISDNKTIKSKLDELKKVGKRNE
jgi:hypothetical protein